MRFTGQVAVVTGAARGIGHATAARLAREGAQTFLADRDLAAAQEAAAALQSAGYAAQAIAIDVAARASVAAAFATIAAAHGRIDILVNNAGIAGRSAPLEEITDDDWDTMMAIDLKSMLLCCQAVMPGMKARGGGRIVNVASIAGKEGNPGMIPYSAAKAGVIGFTKALAKEVGRAGIYVNAVSPAVIQTPILDQLTPEQVDYMVQRIPLGRVGQPEEVAALICWLASDEASFTTGQCVDISGGRATY